MYDSRSVGRRAPRQTGLLTGVASARALRADFETVSTQRCAAGAELPGCQLLYLRSAVDVDHCSQMHEELGTEFARFCRRTEIAFCDWAIESR